MGAPLGLRELITTHRGDLINRCRVKAQSRRITPEIAQREAQAVPAFLDQLASEMGGGTSQTRVIAAAAAHVGAEALRSGLTPSQLVHSYGDACQAITDLAIDLQSSVAPEDFRTLNRCLDDAIAAAVTAYFEESQRLPHRESASLLRLVQMAIAGVETLQTGQLGVSGSTATLVARCLAAMNTTLSKSGANRSPVL